MKSWSKSDFVNYRISKSHETFNDAKLLATNERWNSSMNRLYYSSFHLITALLLKHQIKAETHNGVRTQFFLNFIKTGIVDKESGKLYADLFEWRQESDYADFIEFDRETVLPMLQQVEILNKSILSLILK